MINGKEFAEKMFSDVNNDNNTQEKLYSTGSEELDAMLEKAFSEGYEAAQKEFAKKDEGKHTGAKIAGAAALGAGAGIYGAEKLGEGVSKLGAKKMEGAAGKKAMAAMEGARNGKAAQKKLREKAEKMEKTGEKMIKTGNKMQEPMKVVRNAKKQAIEAAEKGKGAVVETAKKAMNSKTVKRVVKKVVKK